MSFLLPAALALAALSLVVLALHGSRQRRVTVPGLLLWQELRKSSALMAPAWRMPRPSPALILQILAMLVLALALARPLWGESRPVDHFLVVVDNSAALSLSDDSGPRFAAALDQLEAFAATATGAGRFSLLTTNAEARPVAVRQAFTPAAFRAALGRIAPGEAAPDWAGISSLLDGILRDGEASRLLLVSAAPLAAEILDGVETDIVAVGVPVANAALAARLLPVDPEAGLWRAEGTVETSDGAPPDSLSLSMIPQDGGGATALSSIAISANGAFSAEITLPHDGIVEMALPDDAGGFDNRAWFVVAPPQLRQILNLGAPDHPLLAALAAAGDVSVTHAETLPDETAGYDLVILADAETPAPAGITTLRLGEPGEARLHRPVAWDETHPLSSDIPWRDLAVDTVAPFDAAPGALVLVESADGPLITVSADGARREIRLAFDPRFSNWPASAAFPAFAANLLDWLGPRRDGWLRPGCTVGMPCRIDGALVGGVRTPFGAAEGEIVAGQDFVPDRAGLFRLAGPGRSQWLAVNPAPSPISLTASQPAETPQWPVELTWWFIAAALAFLLLDAGLALLRGERGGWLALRGAAVLAGVVALFDPAVPLPAPPPVTVTVADGVDAVPATGGIVAGGAVLRDVDASNDVAVVPRHDDAAASLRLAAAMLPDRGGGIVMQTTVGGEELAGLAGEFAARGLVLNIMVPTSPSGEVGLEALSAPGPHYAGDRFTLSAEVQAAAAGPATLTVSRDGAAIYTVPVTLAIGANRFDLPLTEPQAGSFRYAVAVAADGDAIAENNERALWLDFAPPPRIAVFSQDAGPRAEFARMLRGQGFEALDLAPGRAPIRLDVYERYDGVVLLDMPAIALETRQMAVLEQAVREEGLGLLILGGPHSFGPGGYLETPLEALSPLSSRMPHEAPEVAMTLVLDSSGSMSQIVGGRTRLDLAKQSVQTAASLLDPASSAIGVVMFSSDADVVLPLQPVPDAATLDAALAAVQPGGGTAIYPGLVAAYRQLAEADAAARHIVVMTDGMSDPADFPGLLATIREAGITVSAVAIGSTAETNIAEDIAILGRGRFHATADFEALPSIISQEALMLAGEAIEQGAFPLVPAGSRPDYLAGLPETLGPVAGFVQTTAKPDSEAIWNVVREDGEARPLLASWRYGMGHVMALATAATGRWTAAWQAEEAYPRLFAQALRQFLPRRSEPITLSVTQAYDRITVSVDVAQSSEAPRLAVTGPDGVTIDVPLQPADASQGDFVPAGAGTHRLQVTAGDETKSVSFEAAYPAALSLSHQLSPFASLAERTGGRLLAPGDAPSPVAGAAWTAAALRPVWLALAVGLFLFDLIWRYRGRPRLKPKD
jgi:hypothetical protein